LASQTRRSGSINASPHNILGEDVYGCLRKAYLRREALTKLLAAQAFLRAKHPGYALKVLEGARPRRVQRRMYDLVKNTTLKRYVANPETGSMHNYGTAVDITIVDEHGRELDMGKPDPRMTLVGKGDAEIWLFLTFNWVSDTQKKNRALLASAMTLAGFHPLKHEWWHFEAFEKGYVRAHFSVIE
jgi:D-alanyl-D-alanine dipeptidase